MVKYPSGLKLEFMKLGGMVKQMSKSPTPDWVLYEDWAIGRDPYNWVLYRKFGKRWRPVGYYRNPELLLLSFHRKLLRLEPPKPTLVEHIEHCFDVAQAAADLFEEHISTQVSVISDCSAPAANTAPERDVSTCSQTVEVDHAS